MKNTWMKVIAHSAHNYRAQTQNNACNEITIYRPTLIDIHIYALVIFKWLYGAACIFYAVGTVERLKTSCSCVPIVCNSIYCCRWVLLWQPMPWIQWLRIPTKKILFFSLFFIWIKIKPNLTKEKKKKLIQIVFWWPLRPSFKMFTGT